MKEYNSFAEFARAHEGEVFRYLVYRRLFTPHEQEEKYIDETEFTDIYYSHGRIAEVIWFPGINDCVIGFETCDRDCVFPEDGEDSVIEYHLLSDIKLSLFDHDNNKSDGSEDNLCGDIMTI